MCVFMFLEMQFVASNLCNVVQMTSLVDPALLTAALSSLTNIAVLNTWHKETKCILHKLYSLLDEGHWNRDGVSLQSLRLLINLSCNEDMVPSLLAAEVNFLSIYSRISCFNWLFLCNFSIHVKF